MVDWDAVKMETGWSEDEWIMEVSIENPFCPVLERRGNLPNKGNGQKRVFEDKCNSCYLWECSPSGYPVCPWAIAMAEELIALDQI